MSPEQAVGERDLDARTDVYSLGCVLYEMLVGELPGTWQTDEALKLGMFTDGPHQPRARLHEVGRHVERVLVRALTLRAHDRFETVDAFLLALRGEETAVRRYSDSGGGSCVVSAKDVGGV